MKCSGCPHRSYGERFDYRSLNCHEKCAIVDKEIGLTITQQEKYAPDWCPIEKGAIQVKEEEIEQLAVELEKGMEHTVHLWQARKIIAYLLQNGWKKEENDTNPTEDCQHSEKKPQEKCQFSPEMPDSIAGIPVSDLLFIAQIMGCNPRLIGQIKDGYAFGHAVGYEAGFKLFEKKLHEAILKMSSEPIRLEQEGNFDFTKVKFEIPPYKQHDEVINMARLYGVPVFTPKGINVVNPSTDGDDKK